MRAGTTRRAVAVAGCVLVALLLQATVLPPFAWQVGGDGPQVLPDLVLLVVAAVALLTDARTGTLVGFGAGLLLDLAPPADHLAGRWALALLVVGYAVGRLAHDDREPERSREQLTWPLVLAAAAGGSFVGSTVYALTGLLLGESGSSVGALIVAVLLAAVQDAVAAVLVVPLVRRALTRGDDTGRPTSSARPPRGRRGPAPRPARVTERSWARVG